MKTILVPIDMTATAVPVCETAAELATALDARLLILHVVPRPTLLVTGRDAEVALDKLSRSARVQASRRMVALARWLEGRCPRSRMMVCVGAPAARIVQSMRATKPDFVVIGSHSHTAAHDFVVGSTTHTILRKAICPIVVVPVGRKTRQRLGSRSHDNAPHPRSLFGHHLRGRNPP